MEPKMLRHRARVNLAGNWGIAIAVAAIAAILGGLLSGTSFLPTVQQEISHVFPILQEWEDPLRQGIHTGNVKISFQYGAFGLAAFLLGGTLQLGYSTFLLKQHDRKEAAFQDLFSQFHRFGTGFAQYFLRNLYVALWSLLLIIPGIVKSYSYAMTPFLLAEHPELTASQAIDLSQQLMDGHKMDLFLLDLTFLGWDLLASLPANLGHLALNPYKNAARAAFYRQLQSERTVF